MLNGVRRLITFLCSAPRWFQSWVDSSWTGRPDTPRNEPSWGGEPNTSRNEPWWRGERNAPNDESWVDQLWLSTAPRTQATTRANQSDSHFQQDDDDDAYGDLPDSYINDDEDYLYVTQSWSTPPPRYDTVRRPEPLWQPYHIEQYDHEVKTVDKLRHLGTFGMKPPYRFGTHEDDPLLSEYTKLDPQVLVITSSAMAHQRRSHQFLSPGHAAVVSSTNAANHKLRRVIDIDNWGRTAPFPYETMRSAPDTSFDEHGNAGSAPSYQWYTKIEVACQNVPRTLVRWRQCNEELDWRFRNNLVETDLPDQIARLNRMHRDICGIDNLMHVADGSDLFFRY